MAIPDGIAVAKPALIEVVQGCRTVRDVAPSVAARLGLSEEEKAELIPSGTRTRLVDRVGWAFTHLLKAGLIERVSRGEYVATQAGRDYLANGPQWFTRANLRNDFPAYDTWQKSLSGSHDDPSTAAQEHGGADVLSPDEQIHVAFETAVTLLEEDLLQRVIELSPARFEKLIVDLLLAMGYGRGNPDAGRAIGRSGDGGIDGIIDEDALGLDAVYIQAKRYAPENKVGRPAIQQFVGSLTGESATKGVFVTTSDFSAEARAYVSRVQQRIVLVDGRQLARLMIVNGIGVRTRQVYELRSVDEDYFIDT